MSANLFKRTGEDDFPTHLKVMVSGPPKSGKTTLLGTIPGLIVLDTEPHANNLASISHLDVPYVTITNSDDLRQVAFMLKDPTLRRQVAAQYGLPEINGVAIDTLDTLQKILKTERMKEQRTTQFLRDDWGWLKTEMEAIVEMFTALPMHVFFMVHTKNQEMGKGDDSYTVVMPGLQGSIAESIAGMVGYSLLSFRKEEIAGDGTPYTKYWLRTEGDATHDFLGTRTGGRLPAVIEPDMRTIYRAVIEGKPKTTGAAQAPTAPPAQTPDASTDAPSVMPDTSETGGDLATSPVEEVAQTQGQPDPTPVVAPVAEAPPVAAAPPADSDGRPDPAEPINPAALTHVKRVYDSLEVAFPEALITEQVNMGQARDIVKMWRAIQQDHAEGKAPVGTSPQGEMLEYLTGMGWVSDDAPEEKSEPAVPQVDGTIDQVMAYVDGDLIKVQEAYDLECAKGEGARKSLVAKLESLGAKVQTVVETPIPATTPASEVAVTSEPSAADVPATEEEAVQAAQEGLGAVVVEQGLREDAPCEVCGEKIDDYDLAELGVKRFQKVLCVKDYLAEMKK